MTAYRSIRRYTRELDRSSALWLPLASFWLRPIRALFPLALRVYRAIVRDFGIEQSREFIAQARREAASPERWQHCLASSVSVDASRVVWRELAAWAAEARDCRAIGDVIAVASAISVAAGLRCALAIVRTIYLRAEDSDRSIKRALALWTNGINADGIDKASAAYARRIGRRLHAYAQTGPSGTPVLREAFVAAALLAGVLGSRSAAFRRRPVQRIGAMCTRLSVVMANVVEMQPAPVARVTFAQACAQALLEYSMLPACADAITTTTKRRKADRS
jgi:hypothetical protein